MLYGFVLHCVCCVWHNDVRDDHNSGYKTCNYHTASNNYEDYRQPVPNLVLDRYLVVFQLLLDNVPGTIDGHVHNDLFNDDLYNGSSQPE